MYSRSPGKYTKTDWEADRQKIWQIEIGFDHNLLPQASSLINLKVIRGNESHFPTSVLIQSLILFQIAHAHTLSYPTMWGTAYFSSMQHKGCYCLSQCAQMGETLSVHPAWRVQWKKMKWCGRVKLCRYGSLLSDSKL